MYVRIVSNNVTETVTIGPIGIAARCGARDPRTETTVLPLSIISTSRSVELYEAQRMAAVIEDRGHWTMVFPARTPLLLLLLLLPSHDPPIY
jgi:hypothetical protein